MLYTQINEGSCPGRLTAYVAVEIGIGKKKKKAVKIASRFFALKIKI